MKYNISVEVVSTIVDVSKDVYDIIQYMINFLVWSACFLSIVVMCSSKIIIFFIRFG